MTLPTLRAWWFHRQGLGGTMAGLSAADVLARTGWARSVGGASPYLTLFARARITREQADAGAANAEICELPSARGCTYVLPAAQYALGLKVGQEFAGAEMKQALKLGVTEQEIEKLCDAVERAVATETLGPDEIRDAVGTAARSLGPAGQKAGVTSTMPIALGRLQAQGRIRRISTTGRFDNQRFRYRAWRPGPFESIKLSVEEARTELARLYFRWIGPATLAEFQWFSGSGVKASKAAVEPLKLMPMEAGSDRLMFAEDLEALHAFTIPRKPVYSLAGSLDGVVLLRRDFKSLLDQPSFEGLKNVADLPCNAILDRGQLVGLWEYDPDTESIAWLAFGKKDAGLTAAVKETEAFCRQQLGDVRSFSLDTPKSRAPRIQALRDGKIPG